MSEMSFLDLQNRVAWAVAGPLSSLSTDYKDQIKYAINAAITSMTNRVRFQSAREEHKQTLSDGQPIYKLPARASGIVVGTIWSEADPDKSIGFASEQDWTLYGQQSTSETGSPQALTDLWYDTRTKRWKYRIRPTPSSKQDGEVIHMMIYVSPAKLVADADVPGIPEQLHEHIVHGAVVLGFPEVLRDRGVMEMHAGAWREGVREASKLKDILIGRRTPLRGTSPRAQPQNIRSSVFTNFDLPT